MRILFILLLAIPQFSVAQDSAFTLVRSYKGDIADAIVDNLGNLYIVASNGQIRKFNAAGDSVAVYNQVRNYGKLFTVDVSNPLKILLFYKDFCSIVVLDRFLASIATVNLKSLDILQPAAIGLSYDNNIWVFDEYDNKLKKINEQGKLLQESSDFRIALNQSLTPQRILNDNGLVFLADTASGVYVFDNYGSFKRKIPLVNWESIAVNRDQVISTGKESIIIYNTTTMLQTERKKPFFQPYFRSFMSADQFISFSTTELHIYKYQH